MIKYKCIRIDSNELIKGISVFTGINIETGELSYVDLFKEKTLAIHANTGYGKTNMLNTILMSLIETELAPITILESKGVEYTKVSNVNITAYTGEQVRDGILELRTQLAFLCKGTESPQPEIIVFDEIMPLVLSDDELFKYVCEIISMAEELNWIMIHASQSKVRIVDDVESNVRLYGRVNEGVGLDFPNDIKTLELGEFYLKVKDQEVIKIIVPFVEMNDMKKVGLW